MPSVNTSKTIPISKRNEHFEFKNLMKTMQGDIK